MKNLSAKEMLIVWEHGLNQPMLQRSLLMLLAAYPETSPDEALELSIGSRDIYLLQLRERLFGSHLINTAKCSQCTERVEWENEVADFCNPELTVNLSSKNLSLDRGDYHLCFRLPNSNDIVEILRFDQKKTTESDLLLRRCVITAEKAGTSIETNQLPGHVIDALEKRIDELDPLSQIRIDLTCPECSHQWHVVFDIVSFLWTEINNWAERMLLTIHKLASGYGWSEQEILNLSPVRRQLYLGMLGS